MRYPAFRSGRTSLYMMFLVIGCTLLNVALCYCVVRLDLPLYLDTIGTIFISILGGAFPGIMTAFLTNLLSSFFSDSIYFSFINILVAVCAAWFSKNDKFKRKINILYLILILSVISGVLGTVFQWLLLGQPQFSYVAEISRALAGNSHVAYLFMSLLWVVCINFIDKGISVILALVSMSFLRDEFKRDMWNSGWKQTPPSNEEIINIRERSKKEKVSLRTRVTFLLVAAALAMTLALSFVSTRVNYEDSKAEGRKTVENAVTFAASMMDVHEIKRFIRNKDTISPYEDPVYQKYNQQLLSLREAFGNIEYIYMYQIEKDGCHTIFDTDELFQNDMKIGAVEEFDESYIPLVPALLAGKKIPVQEAESRYGYLVTAYMPLYDEEGNCVAYMGADLALDKLSQYVREFLIKMSLVFSGFFTSILAYGLWVSGHHLVYPIGTLENSIAGFMEDIDDQEKLDSSVRKLQKLDIRTGDEVESLYKSICEMAEGTSEQMRKIRMLARSNEKMQSGLIITMADMVENRDSDTGAHVQKTAAYVGIILRGLSKKGYYTEKLTQKYISDVEMSAPLHDIGKIKVPDEVLNKPGKLTEEEFEIMKTHTTAGRDILENAISTVEGENYLKEARNMALYHHERWDGKGYPEGLHGQVIPLSARVMAVADVFDALTSPRVYKPAFTLEKAIEIIEQGSGSQFDPKCVEVFIESLGDIKSVLKKYQG